MSEFDLRSLLESLNDRDISFVVIGGVAVAAHGYVRATEDLDIVPEPDGENLEKLSLVLSALGATLPTAEHRRFNAVTDKRVLTRGENITLDTKFGGLDIVQRGPGLPSFSELIGHAVSSDVLGAPVMICSLEQLKAMKRAQGRSQDRADIEALEADGPL